MHMYNVARRLLLHQNADEKMWAQKKGRPEKPILILDSAYTQRNTIAHDAVHLDAVRFFSLDFCIVFSTAE